jgi:hypothetical protein
MNRKPTWDLYKDGISYSLLCKFRNCRERFRIATVEGLRPSERKEAMEFGTIFHKALEYTAQGKTTSQVITQLLKFYQSSSMEPMLVKQACILVPHYNRYYANEKHQYVAQEEVFDIPYKSTTTGKIIRLRGRRDEMFKRKGALWLQENKTKTNIDENKILATLPFDLQTMLYVYSMTQDYKGQKIGGVLYNVIRRPGQKQRQNESDNEFLQRINDEVAKDVDTSLANNEMSHYFKRYEVELTQSDINNFYHRTLVPMIESVVVWWESIKSNPFNPWVDEQGKPNPHHFQNPFGIFDPMTIGVGDYFDYVTSGSKLGLDQIETCFPELQGEQGQVKKKATTSEEKPKKKPSKK